MCRPSPTPVVVLLLASVAVAQEPAPHWRQVGNAVVEAGLASAATGPVARVWYSSDGARLFARTHTGKVFQTDDFETWTAAPQAVPPPSPATVEMASLPEAGARTIQAGAATYALGRAVYRTEDSGRHWLNLTRFRGQSILGEGLADLAVSPRDPEELAIAGRWGVWRSVDGGLSWSGLNQSLPNLPVRRLLRVPRGSAGAVVLLDELGEVAWAPGEKAGWRPVQTPASRLEEELRRALSQAIGEQVVAAAASGSYLYAGGRNGTLWTSLDQGRNWRTTQLAGAGLVTAIHVDASEPRLAVAAFGDAAREQPGPRIARTVNGGLFWDDLTANLPGRAAFGVAADRATGAVYVASDAGVFLTYADLLNPSAPTPWTALRGLPEASVTDVRLDEAGNQLFAAVEGYGVFAATAPHRRRDPRLVNAADFSMRPAAPGSLLSVLGATVRSAAAGSWSAPVLASGDHESQIQVPFEVSGPRLDLELATTSAARLDLAVALLAASPAIFIDRDGSPMLLDADTGVLLDTVKTARSGARVQILATGLGKVRPDWPAGLPAPLEAPPRVSAAVRVYLDGTPVEVTRATLAPGYVGFYLVEFVVPDVVNFGPAELFIDAAGAASNRVTIFLEP
jgi:uncharacterized protein (TIGR03437 family)